MQFAVKESHGSEKPPFPICDIIELVIVGRGHKTFRSILPAKNKVIQMMCSSKCMPAIRIISLPYRLRREELSSGIFDIFVVIVFSKVFVVKFPNVQSKNGYVIAEQEI